jgi:Fe-S cluster assembly protein SufD
MSETITNDYLNCILNALPADLQNSGSQDTLDWLRRLRNEAIDQAGQLRFPTVKDEEWRFTDVSPLAKLPYKPAQKTSALRLSDIQPFCIAESAHRLVFVDGFFSPELSQLSEDNQFKIGNLTAPALAKVSLAEGHLGQHVQFRDNFFAALNTAFLQDGALIVLSENCVVSSPIHLLFIATQEQTTNYPRCLLIGERNSQAMVIEDYVALGANAYITNSVAEFSLADNAQVSHIRVQRESSNAFHLASSAVSLEQNSQYRSVSITFGALISRFNLDVEFNAQAAECTIDGLAMTSVRQLADTHTRIDHAKPHCTSHQQHKCIADDSSHAVFNGKIIVRPHAQRTNSSQSSRNLLLSDKAQIDTKPQLEIFADDVKCAHGATVGQLDNEEIFYLKSRGLNELAARNLLTYAFGAEILDRIAVPSLKHTLEQTVLNQTTRTQSS